MQAWSSQIGPKTCYAREIKSEKKTKLNDVKIRKHDVIPLKC